MKIAIISDIHANVDALKSVLNEIDELRITKILISGDFIGYYYNPKEVMDLILSRDIVACRGNHEDLFHNWITQSGENRNKLKIKYGSGFQIAEDQLLNAQKSFLFSLNHPVFKTLDNIRFCIAHGSPWDINQYIYFDKINNAKDKLLFYSENCDVIILGHTHYQGLTTLDNLIILNPGSVGQPRSGKSFNRYTARADWAIIDTHDLSVSFMTTMYDTTSLFKQIDKYDPTNSYLKTVLHRAH